MLYADKVNLVETPDGFPYEVILSSVYGGSNISHTYHIYSTTPTLKKIGEVKNPINKWRANQGNGSEKEVVGFYKDKGAFLIDRMITKGKEVARCNACQKWNVETLIINGDTISSLDMKIYNKLNF